MSAASQTEEQRLILRTVRDFVDREVIPVASAMEHRGEYPHALADQMAKLGLFGLNIPEEFGGTEVDYVTFARIFVELSRGWLGLAGIIGTHLVLCDVMVRFATEEQKRRFFPAWRPASGAAESVCRSPTRAPICKIFRPSPTRDGDIYRVNGSKMWITNARYGNTFLLLAKTDPTAQAGASRDELFRDRKRRAGFSC